MRETNFLFLCLSVFLLSGCGKKTAPDYGDSGYYGSSDGSSGTSHNICGDCSSDADCGSGETCIAYDETRNVCSMDCYDDGTCPGNSDCWTADLDGDGSTYYICLSDDATTPCPPGWSWSN